MEEKKQDGVQFIVCPTCEGRGKRGAGLVCPNCSGMGMGAFFEGKFFYWGLTLTQTTIKLRHLKKGLHFILNSIAYLVGLFGLLALGWWIWLTQESFSDFGSFYFWREQNILILIFWISVVADMFIFYRVSETRHAKHKIKRFKYRDDKKLTNIPSDWRELKRFKNKIDVSGGFGKESIQTIEEAFILAKKSKHSKVEIMHLFLASLNRKKITAVFARLNIPMDKIVEKINRQLDSLETSKTKPVMSNNVKKVLIEAYSLAYISSQEKVDSANFILPAMNRGKDLSEILYDMEVNMDKMNNCLEWFRINEEMLENYKIYKKMARFKPGKNMDRAYTSVATPVLNQYAYDLTASAKWGKLEFCVDRVQEIETIFQTLESGKSGIILVGPNGIGKSTIINGVAQLMVKEDVPKILRDKRLLELDASRLVSGANPAQVQERMLIMIDEIARAGNIILFIDNIENIIGITSGSEESLDLSEVLAQALERGIIYCLASATSQNYTKYIEGKPLGDLMQKIDILEPEVNQAIQIIESKAGFMEGKYKIYFSYNAIESAVKLSSKYMHDKYLPSKAIDVLEKTAVKISKERGEKSLVTKEDVAITIGEITHIPTTKITASEGKELLNLEDKIHERMVNQEEAVNMVSASLRRARAELRDGKRPIANFLFLGPTGVGKTELAKSVAQIYFGDEKYMIRLDMSEYQHPDSVKKMIGDTTGTRGYLTEAVRKAPFSLILLDELEKAHADILNLFLQVMDDGRLTDGQGKTIDFTNSIIIATSNAGSIYIQEQVAKGAPIEEIKNTLINEHLNKTMRPELINRFDGVVVFKPLSMGNVKDIAKLMLNKTKKMLLIKGIGLRYSDEGVARLAEEGYDPKFGARPLRRLLQEKVENIIANKILAGELGRRDTVVINDDASIGVEKGREL